jgi:acyl carrier protein|tara:strand:- start:181 stop:420 length:240 start_codon:yes stop_codon:yes gene_type:complete
MSNLDKYKKAFLTSLNIDDTVFNEKLKYNDIPEWDSIGHMSLISELEDEFNITIETDDIVDFSSYKKGISILKNYKIII